MPTIQVRELPDHIYEALTQRAQQERRSLSQQVVATLAHGLNVDIDPKQRRLEALEEARRRGPVKNVLDHVALMREDRNR
jgi:plasmid stability protein